MSGSPDFLSRTCSDLDLIGEERGGVSSYGLVAFVTSDFFGIGVSLVIFASVLVMRLEVDDWQHPWILQVANHFLVMFFLLEWCLRIFVHGAGWIRNRGHMLDTMIVWIPGVMVVWILQPLLYYSEVGGNLHDFSQTLAIFRMLRMLRLLKVAALFRKYAFFKDVWLLIRGLVDSMNTLLSAMFLIVSMVLLFGILAVELIGHAVFVSPTPLQTEAQEKFQGLGRAMISLTRFMNGDDSQDIMDSLIPQQPYIWIFFWTFIAITSYVLLNLVTAVIVQQSLEITRGDEEATANERTYEQQIALIQFELIFNQLDEDGSGRVTLEEFKAAFELPGLKNKLINIGFEENELLELFGLLDTDGEGELEMEEFVTGMQKLRGVATSKDMIMLIKGISRIDKMVQKLKESAPDQKFSDHDEPRRATEKDTEDAASRLNDVQGMMGERLMCAGYELDELTITLKTISDDVHALFQPEGTLERHKKKDRKARKGDDDGDRSKKKKAHKGEDSHRHHHHHHANGDDGETTPSRSKKTKGHRTPRGDDGHRQRRGSVLGNDKQETHTHMAIDREEETREMAIDRDQETKGQRGDDGHRQRRERDHDKGDGERDLGNDKQDHHHKHRGDQDTPPTDESHSKRHPKHHRHKPDQDGTPRERTPRERTPRGRTPKHHRHKPDEDGTPREGTPREHGNDQERTPREHGSDHVRTPRDKGKRDDDGHQRHHERTPRKHGNDQKRTPRHLKRTPSLLQV